MNNNFVFTKNWSIEIGDYVSDYKHKKMLDNFCEKNEKKIQWLKTSFVLIWFSILVIFFHFITTI